MTNDPMTENMDEKKDTPPPIIDQLKEYAETRIKLARYQAIEGGTSIAAGLIADAVSVGSIVLACVFASCTLGFYLGRVFGADWMGFGIVAILYAIFAIAVRLNKKSLERPIVNAFLRKIFKS